MWQANAAQALQASGVRYRALTSESTDSYNCIAWAAGDDRRKWWPWGPVFWPGRPRNAEFDDNVQEFQRAFATLGYRGCAHGALEPGFEKVAIYTRANCVTHAARQLPNGAWTSKLGDEWDIEHDIDGVQTIYGIVACYLRRPRPAP